MNNEPPTQPPAIKRYVGDKPPETFIFPFCWFGHKWGNWKLILSKSYAWDSWRTVQERTCEKCGKYQIEDKIK